jgi:hypothetical protein
MSGHLQPKCRNPKTPRRSGDDEDLPAKALRHFIGHKGNMPYPSHERPQLRDDPNP